MHHPLTTKRLSIDLSVTHIMSPRALYWQFYWDLVLSKRPTDTTDYCGRGVGHTGNLNWSVDSWTKRIISIGYVCWQEVAASRRETRAVYRAELPQNEYLIYASLVRVQLPDPRIWKNRVKWRLSRPGLAAALRWWCSSCQSLVYCNIIGAPEINTVTYVLWKPGSWIYINFFNGRKLMNASKIWFSYLQVFVLYLCQILQAYKSYLL